MASAHAAISKPPGAERAPIALILDLQSGQALYAAEPDRRFVPASVTKVMTAYVAFEMIASGELDPERRIEVSADIAKEWSGAGSTMFLEGGERVTLEQLLMGLTTVSANDAAIVLATKLAGSVDGWLERMNAAARDLDMRDSHFATPNGWPDEGRTYTTAADLAKLARAMVERHPDLYARFFGHRGYAHNGRAQANHDPISGRVKGADGIKTGHTREAGYNFLGSAEREGRRLVLVIAASDTMRDRASAAREFIEWGFVTFENRPLFAPGAVIGEAKVQGGASRTVSLLAGKGIFAAVPPDSAPAMELEIRYPGPLQAPIAAGSNVAQLRISIDGQPDYEVPLQAAGNVPRANAWQRLRNGFLGLVS